MGSKQLNMHGWKVQWHQINNMPLEDILGEFLFHANFKMIFFSQGGLRICEPLWYIFLKYGFRRFGMWSTWDIDIKIKKIMSYLSAGSSNILCSPEDTLPLMSWVELWSWKRLSCCWMGVGLDSERVISPRIRGRGPSLATVACRKELSPWVGALPW